MTEAAQQLAAGFAAQVVKWAQGRGCDAATVDALHGAALAVSLATSAGHICVALADDAGLLPLRERLARSGLVGTPQHPGSLPLILDAANRLYLHRHFDDERRLAQRLVGAARARSVAPAARAEACLDALFPPLPGPAGSIDWQRAAVEQALGSRLTLISGGPGTGKTTTVVKLIACLLAGDPQLRVVLCAPTGKARARLIEAMRQRAGLLPVGLAAQLPEEAFTVHRLLGIRPGDRAQHHAGNPLNLDVLVVDEASMLDLSLATRLVDALPLHARLVLVGDRNQLAAVESGAVFAEACGDAGQGPLSGAVIELRDNYRFGSDSPIGRLAADISAGRAADALALLRRIDGTEICWIPDQEQGAAAALHQQLSRAFAPYFAAVAANPADCAGISRAFGACRVLCAVREGARGVAGLNERIELAARLQLQPVAESLGVDPRARWYPGRAVLVTQNDYATDLMNGDIGITLPDASGQLRVFFAAADGGFRALAPGRLPPHETAFATTVHKAQGSEFDAVLLVLPEVPIPVVTRELLYTAITRARSRVTLVAGERVLTEAIGAPTRRLSGLPERLREAAAAGGRDILEP